MIKMDFDRAIEFLRFDFTPFESYSGSNEDDILEVGKGRHSVTFPARLHKMLMRDAGYNKRKVSTVVRIICNAYYFGNLQKRGGSIVNDIQEQITKATRKKTKEERKQLRLRQSLMTELKTVLASRKIEDDTIPQVLSSPPPPPPQ